METYYTRYHDLNRLLSGVHLWPLDQCPDKCRQHFYDFKDRDLFCGLFSLEEISDTFQQTGCLAFWLKQGFKNIRFSTNRDEKFRYQLTIDTIVENKKEILCDIVIWLEYLEICRLNSIYPAFCVDSLKLQQPGKFCTNPMPGQTWASSHILKPVFSLISRWAIQTGAMLISEIPEYFHTACIFDRYFKFVDPEMAGIFEKIKMDLLPESPTHDEITQCSWAFENKQIYRNGECYLWPTEMQVYPLSHEIEKSLQIPIQIDKAKYMKRLN